MKKTIYITITSLICIGLGNSAIADEVQASMAEESQGSFFSDIFNKSHFEKNFSASVGVKAWVNNWDFPVLWMNKTQTNEKVVRSFNSDTENTFFPVLSFRYKNFFVSSSYFPKTNYSFEKQNTGWFVANDGKIDSLAEAGSEIPVGWELSAERSEWDINLGYYLFPSLAVTVGYKVINRDLIMSSTIVPGTKFETKIPGNASMDTEGVILGIAGVAPVYKRFGMYGNFAVGWLETEKTGTDFFAHNRSYDTDYYFGELGLVYSSNFDKIPMLNTASFHLGYRFQVLNDQDELKSTDTTSGLVLGVNLSF